MGENEYKEDRSLFDSCGGFNTPTLCVVTKGIKAECNHLMRTTYPDACVGGVDWFYNYGNDNEHSFPDIGDLSNDKRKSTIWHYCKDTDINFARFFISNIAGFAEEGKHWKKSAKIKNHWLKDDGIGKPKAEIFKKYNIAIELDWNNCISCKWKKARWQACKNRNRGAMNIWTFRLPYIAGFNQNRLEFVGIVLQVK